jgi:hypothetical protein
MSPERQQTLRVGLEHSRAQLVDALAGMDEAAFRSRDDMNWTAAEVLAHLLANEQRLTEIARLALKSERPAVQSRGEAQREHEAKSAQRMPVPQIWHGLLAQRRETVHLLASLKAGQLARTAVHSRFGEVSVAWLLRRLADHEAEHANQIRELRQALTAGRAVTDSAVDRCEERTG